MFLDDNVIKLLLLKLYISGDTLVSSIVEIDEKYVFKASILSVSELASVLTPLTLLIFIWGTSFDNLILNDSFKLISILGKWEWCLLGQFTLSSPSASAL